MIVKIELNPSIIDKHHADLRSVFYYPANKRIIPLEDFQRYINRLNVYHLLDYTYKKHKKIAVQRLLRKLGVVLFYCKRSLNDCKN